MAPRTRHGDERVSSSERQQGELYRAWLERYGPVVAEQLEPQRRYMIVGVGAAEFAFTDFERYVEALGKVWDAGLVPEPRPSAVGADLPEAAPNLQGVDSDLGDLRASDVEPRRRRFS